jgi:hypothetical protein
MDKIIARIIGVFMLIILPAIIYYGAIIIAKLNNYIMKELYALNDLTQIYISIIILIIILVLLFIFYAALTILLIFAPEEV